MTKQNCYFPMLATLSKGKIPEKGWIAEKKFDGMRCLIYKENGVVTIYSRAGRKNNDSFPELVKAALKISNKDFIVDGEIVAFEGKISSFSKLQNRIGLKINKDTKSKTKVFLYLFDLLFFDGKDLRKNRVIDRKKLLKKNFNFSKQIRYTTHRSNRLEQFYEEMCKKGEEGVIAKEIGSRYVPGKRSKKWLKFKCTNQQEFVIGGYTEPGGSRQGFGAILIGYYENSNFKFAGKVGTGFSDKSLKKLKKHFGTLKRKTSPFEDFSEKKQTHWLTPKLVAEIGFEEWTSHNKLRQPRFLGLREDKEPRDIVRENGYTETH